MAVVIKKLKLLRVPIKRLYRKCKQNNKIPQDCASSISQLDDYDDHSVSKLLTLPTLDITKHPGYFGGHNSLMFNGVYLELVELSTLTESGPNTTLSEDISHWNPNRGHSKQARASVV